MIKSPANPPKIVLTPTAVKTQNDRFHVYHSVGEALKNPDNVYQLHIHDHESEKIPETIKQFPHLRALHLHIPKLGKPPLWLAELKELKELVLDGDQFGTEREKLQKEFPHLILFFDYSHKDQKN